MCISNLVSIMDSIKILLTEIIFLYDLLLWLYPRLPKTIPYTVRQKPRLGINIIQ